ncbi:DUF916 and DUF3324 domain-containing protein [Enterococcus crotali]|uniref:DUF916 and DUF3324 domain-containing protein n=1 Tax=Enterococcus crotali TaxID=1453587 RepID=UPI00046F9A18|nr:DUF916 and DUF3324 domain-containing protein [Enterococcus crotali]
MKKRKWLLFLGALNLIVIVFFGNVQKVNANEKDPGGATGFTYKVSFPENQMEENIGFYKLKMAPNAHQVIKIALSNPGKEVLTVDVSLNGAKTNQNGVIEYGDSTIENDASLKFDFKEIVTGPKTVELKPGETKDLDLAIQMPETMYEGTIAGGIQLMRANQKEETDKKGGSQIINQYAYVIGLLLQENDQLPSPNLELNSVKANQDNARNAIFVNFSNIEAAYLNNMTIEVQVTEKNKEAILYERKQTAMRMAPNTFINFPVSMNGEKMVAGKYKAKILVTSDDKKWSWDQEFTIDQKEADKFNERDVGLVQEKGINWQLIALIVGGLVVGIALIFIILVMIRKRKIAKNSINPPQKKTNGKKQPNKSKNKRKDR